MKEVQRHRVIVEAEGCQLVPSDTGFYYDFFESLSDALCMRILVPPVIVRVPVHIGADRIHTEIDSGVSGAVIWLESGAQIHTWPEVGLVAVDVFSCRFFASEDVIDLVGKTFLPARICAYAPALFWSSTDSNRFYVNLAERRGK